MYKDILQSIEEKKIIAILKELSFSQNMKTIETLIESGITNIEISLSTLNALEYIKEAVKEFDKVANIGAGTIKNQEDARKAIEAGARFLVTPNLSINAIEYANTEGVLIIPGVLTNTEIITAQDLGCSMVKLFPVSAVSEKYIKQIKGPLDNVKIMAVGGVDMENASKYINLGVNAVGVGSALIRRDLIEKGDYDSLKIHFEEFKNKLNIG
ncbi:bifunctional 4-hydroxy-2-oxoglutarate aldolase/2-dehydro-3-deoxy-phosphogluconate aldolase [Clostridium sp.]|jgi:2-dehydro-3-deoxyphosphogluconate aldolase / (4S)-4-hydroxy-2-oxoglutarate aldolase|uniref:bifunctional 4-hydroxy-2-oxoglutarate aldolase/2-dehydro-3-deoxy-phosphogluconate aldolase n=1 Tax=Clostridium sp. TaxID=1506 RepID=UPI0039F46DE0